MLGLAGWLGMALLCACASRGRGVVTHESEGDVASTDTRGPDGSFILRRALLQEQSGSLLDVLQHYIPSIRVAETSDCPRIYLRGPSTIMTRSDPAIYVGGQRAVNTCILSGLSTADVERVEVYPSGVPRGVGYQTHPYGVIIVFMKTSEPL
jgi:hypothetical protein